MRGNGLGRHAGKDLGKEITALKLQLKKLTEALEAEANDGVSRAINKVESKSHEAIEEAVDAAQAFIEEQAEHARDAARALSQKSGEWREAATDTLVESVQARPLGTLAAIAGIGFLAGYLCRRN